MAEPDEVLVQVGALPDGGPEELADLADGLRAELLDLDVLAVRPVPEPAAPADAKGLAMVAGWLAVQLGSVQRLRAVVEAVRLWSARTGRTVEVNVGGDVLKVSGVTAEQQEEIIDAWLARHAAGT